MPGHRIGPKASEKELQIWKLPKLVPAVQHGQYSSLTMAESQVPGWRCSQVIINLLQIRRKKGGKWPSLSSRKENKNVGCCNTLGTSALFHFLLRNILKNKTLYYKWIILLEWEEVSYPLAQAEQIRRTSFLFGSWFAPLPFSMAYLEHLCTLFKDSHRRLDFFSVATETLCLYSKTSL